MTVTHEENRANHKENRATYETPGLSPEPQASAVGPRLRFREFRRGRPFWAGAFTLLSGLIILFPPYATLRFGDVVVSMNTIGGMSSLLIGVIMMICALTLWTRPEFRRAAGVVTMLLALCAIVAANLGVFLIGTTLGLIGSGLALAWSPRPKATRHAHSGIGGARGGTA